MSKAKIEIVTPQQASSWLSNNPDNRKPSMSHVERLTQDMINGLFVFNGESIILDEDGALMDGQHRLMAIVASKTAQKMLVVKGVPRSTMRTIDRGEARTVADWLKIRGYSNYTTCGHAAHNLHIFEVGSLHRSGATGKFHPADADSVLARHPGLVDSVTFAISLKEMMGLVYKSVGTVAFLHYIFSRVDAQKANEFFTKLATGANLDKDSALWHLRNRLIADNQDKRKKMPPTVRMAFILKAWSFFSKGRAIKRLQYSEEETFPLVEGFSYIDDKPVFP